MKSSNWLWRINEEQCFLYFFRCQFSLLFTPQIGLKFRDRKKQFEQQHYSNGQHLIWRFPGGYWIVCPIALQKLELVVIGYVCLECEVKKKDDVGKQCQTDSAKSVRKVKTVLDKKSTEEYCVQQVGTLVTHTFFSLFFLSTSTVDNWPHWKARKQKLTAGRTFSDDNVSTARIIMTPRQMDRCCCRQCTAKPAAAQLGVTLSKNKLTQLYENTEEQLVNWLTPLLHNKVPPHRRECWGTVCINLASSQCWPVLTLCDNQSVCVSIICFAGELLQINWLCVFDYTALNHRTLLSVYVWTAVAAVAVTHHTHTAAGVSIIDGTEVFWHRQATPDLTRQCQSGRAVDQDRHQHQHHYLQQRQKQHFPLRIYTISLVNVHWPHARALLRGQFILQRRWVFIFLQPMANKENNSGEQEDNRRSSNSKPFRLRIQFPVSGKQERQQFLYRHQPAPAPAAVHLLPTQSCNVKSASIEVYCEMLEQMLQLKAEMLTS